MSPSKALVSLVVLLFSLPLAAATKIWNGSASGAWNNGNNWTPTGIPSGGDDLIFPAGALNPTMTSFNLTFASLTFSAPGYTITGTSFGLTSLTVTYSTAGATTINPQINLTGSPTINVPSASPTLNLGGVNMGGTILTVSGSGTVNVNGVLSNGQLEVQKSGLNPLSLSGSNTYTGVTTISSGVVVAQNDNALGVNVVSVQGGAFLSLSGGINVSNNLTLNGSGFIGAGALVNAGGSNTWSGNISLGSASTISASSGDLTVSGAISGSQDLTVRSNAPAFVALSGANTYQGVTFVTQGTLRALSAGALGSTVSSFNTVVSAGATLEIGVSVGFLEPLVLNGNGVGGTAGALRILSGVSPALNGPITLATASTLFVDDMATLNVEAAVSGSVSASLTKAGTGQLNLNAATNTYAGSTVVSAGVLRVSSSQAQSAVSVNSGGTLKGTGSVGSLTTTSGGTVSPGSSPGILSTGNLALTSGSTYSVELNGTTPGSGYDQLAVTGSVSLGNATLDVVFNFVVTPGDTFTIIQNDAADAVTGTFAGLPEGGILTVGLLQFQVSYLGGTGNDVTLTAVGCTLDTLGPTVTAPAAVTVTQTTCS